MKNDTDLHIIYKLQHGNEWCCDDLTNLSLPATVFFRLDSSAYSNIKTILWDFGDNNIVAITGKKPLLKPMKHSFGDELSTTFVKASAIMADEVLIADTLSFNNLVFDDIAKRVKNYYIDPDALKQRIIQYYKDDILTPELADDVQQLCVKLSYSSRFINYTWREEFIGQAIVRLLRILKEKKYDPTRGFSPFSYLTMCAFRVFITVIKKEKKNFAALQEYQEEFFKRYNERGLLSITEDHEED